MSNLWGVYVRGQVDMVSFALLIDRVANPASNATEVGTAQGAINSDVLLGGSEICLHLRRRSKNEMVMVGIPALFFHIL